MELYDLHTHTFLSDCASKTNANPIDYVLSAKQNGLKAIGFSDHAWDPGIEGASPWYIKQPTDRLRAVKEMLEISDADISGIKIVFGCETEYAGGVIGIGEKAASELDYVIVPHSHTHMRGFVLPQGWESPQKHAEYLLKSFYELCTHTQRKLFFGIAHPMYPVGLSEEAASEVYEYINDSVLAECLFAARDNGLFLELNTSCISSLKDETLENSYYSRFFRAAKTVGNSFFMGSDKHHVVNSPENDKNLQITRYIGRLGLEESDFKKALGAILER